MEIAILIIISLVVGLIVGVLSGMLGIGGGTIMVAVFKLGYGLSAISATATSLFTIIPTSLTGAVTHIRNKTCVPRLGIAAGIGGAITSPIGVYLASLSPDWAIMLGAGIVIAYSSITMLRKAYVLWRKEKKEAAENVKSTDIAENAMSADTAEIDAKQSDASKSETSDDSSSATNPSSDSKVTSQSQYRGVKNIAICVSLGLVTGVLSGYVGVGGGFMMVPLLMQLIGLPMKLTSGTSLIAVMILAIPGTITQAILGNIDWISGIAMSAGAIPGAILGANLMKKIPEVALRAIFGLFLLVVAVLLVVS